MFYYGEEVLKFGEGSIEDVLESIPTKNFRSLGEKCDKVSIESREYKRKVIRDI
jgi:hypothetical protein